MLKFFMQTAAASLCAAFAMAASGTESTWAAGNWYGTLDLGAQQLGIVFEIEADGDAWSGAMDVPAQGATGLPLQSVRVDGDRLTIEMPLAGSARFEGSRRGETIDGTFSQGGQSFPLTLTQAPKVAAPRRPQEPEDPVPYRIDEVFFEGAGATRLVGTLTRPATAGPFPGIVLVAGAGPHDRDGTFMDHRPLLVLADRLTRAGFAVLRFDERGVGDSAGDFASATGRMLAGDIGAGVDFLGQQAGVDAGRLGLIAHSEGGRLAALAVGEHEAGDFVVLLGAPARPGIEDLREQAKRSPNPVARLQAAMAEAALEGEAGDALREAAHAFLETLSDTQRAAFGGRESTIIDQLVQGLSQAQSKFTLAFDPRAALRQAGVPVLALFGDRDRQIDAAGAARAWREVAGSAEVQILAGLNHFFQQTETGAPSEYATIEQTIAPLALATIDEWLGEITGGVQ